jgi:hypothetical protein
MPRIRTIKPELAQDVKLASISREARYAFVLLITQADDEGLVPGAVRQLLGLLYPHDEDVTAADLRGWLAELDGIGAIRRRVTVDGAPVLELTNWSKHQRVDNKGRSQLAGFLAPFAEVRGDSPQLAEVRESSPLGPRTKDLGPRTMDRAARAPRETPPPADVNAVIDHYRHRYPKRRPGGRESKLVVRALQLGYAPADLCEAIDGNAEDPWHIARAKHDLGYVLRDAGKIDDFRAMREAASAPLVDADGILNERGMMAGVSR